MTKTAKRFLCLILALTLALSCAPIIASAATSGTCGYNLTWTMEDGTLTISGTGKMFYYYSSLAPWYSERSSIETIIIEDGVTSIGAYAFKDCSALTNIDIPNSVTAIGESVFSDCYELKSIDVDFKNMAYSSIDGILFNKDLTKIIAYPAGRTDKKYIIPNGVISIDDEAFCYCGSLTNITIPDSVNFIGDYAFRDCNSLTNINIPDSVNFIGDYAFRNCSSLTSIAIPDGVTSIGGGAFSNCSSLTSMAIPDGVTSIGNNAFNGCSSLTSITIPDSVTSIGSSAFGYCKNLTSIHIPNVVTSIGSSAFDNCSSLTSINIPDSITSIEDYAFNYCSSLTSINIPDSITSIENYAFNHCSSLTNINIPDSVTSIGVGAFGYCYSITSIIIPDSVTSIGNYAFRTCNSLTSITIPDSVTSIGEGAFKYCRALIDVYYNGSEDQWNSINLGSDNTYLFYATIHYNYGKTDSTQTTVAKGNNPIRFYAYDGENDSLLNYFAGVTVEIDGFGTQVTGEDGYLEFENTYTDGVSMDTTFIATKEGYRDYISDMRVYNAESNPLFNNNSVSATMTKLYPGDEERPYISTFLHVSPYSNISDLLISDRGFSQDSDDVINLKAYAVWNDKTPGKFVLYQQDGAYFESEDGIFTVRAAQFDTDKDIYIKAVAADGTQSMSEKVNMIIYPPPVKVTGDPNTIPLFDMSGSYTPSDIPFLNDTTVKLDLDLPVTYTVKDGKIRLAVGLIDENDTFADDENWDEWKKVCESVFSHDRTAAEWANDIRNLKFDWTSSVSLDCKAVGYYEVDLTNQNESMEGGLKLSADAKATFQTQYVIGPVPVYFKFSFGDKFGANFIGGYNFEEKSFYGDIQGTIEPYLSAEGGVGVLYVATVGVNGKGSMPTELGLPEGVRKIDLKAELALTASVLCFDYSKTFASQTWNLFPGESAAALSCVFEDTDYKLESRDYIENESVWYGSEPQAQLEDVTALSERTLQTNIYPKAEPQIMNCDGDTVAVWLADNADRNNINKTMLVYSVYGDDGSWSEPQPVYDDGCADFYPYAKDGYVVWQKTNRQLSDTDDMETLAAAGDIMCAKQNGSGFDTAVRVTNNNTADSSPKLAADEDGASVIWTSNSDNNIWGTTGENRIHIKDLSSGAEETFAVSGVVANLDAEYIDSVLEVAYVADTDGDLNTLNDRRLYLYKNGSSADIASGALVSNPRYAEIGGETCLTWYCDDSIYSRDSGGAIKAVYTDESALLSDDFNVISSENGYAAIIWTATKDNENKQIQGAIYNPQSGEWSKEVYISDSQNDVFHPDGIINDDGSMLLIYNRTGEQSDLCATELVPSYDIAIEDVSYNESSVLPNTDLPITLKIKNNGYLDVNSVDVDINGEIQNCAVSLKPGESAEITAAYPIGDRVSRQSLTIEAGVSNETDNTPDDNQTTLEIGYPDAALTLRSSVQSGRVSCLVNVTNNSFVDTTGNLTVRKDAKDGEVIDTIEIGDITNKETRQITYSISNELLASYSDLQNIYFVLETEDEEIYTTNNYDFVAGITIDTESDSEYAYTINALTPTDTGVTISLTKNVELSGTQVLIAAAYDKSGAMISCNTADAALPAGAADDIAIVLDTTNAAEIRAFVWDGFGSLTPLSNSFSLTL